MRVLLTGSTGRLGGAFLSLWGDDPKYDLSVLTRADADLAQPDILRRVLGEIEFDVLVNPAAMSGLEECLDAAELARKVNTVSPQVMAEVCHEKGAKLVHFSTDYVFAGDVEERKRECDPAQAVNIYGATKLAGEVAVMKASDQALVCRVSWLFGPTSAQRPSHFDHVIERALRGESQYLIGDKYSVPTFTHDIVEWVSKLIDHEASGLYHLCNAGEPESWLSYGKKVCDLAGISTSKIQEATLEEADFFREKRPVFTAMLPERLVDEGVATPRHWTEAAQVYLEIR